MSLNSRPNFKAIFAAAHINVRRGKMPDVERRRLAAVALAHPAAFQL
jgi:hypothetical protein